MTDKAATQITEEDLETEQPERRRTVFVWLIFAYACFVLIIGLIGMGMVIFGVPIVDMPLPAVGAYTYIWGFISRIEDIDAPSCPEGYHW